MPKIRITMEMPSSPAYPTETKMAQELRQNVYLLLKNMQTALLEHHVALLAHAHDIPPAMLAASRETHKEDLAAVEALLRSLHVEVVP